MRSVLVLLVVAVSSLVVGCVGGATCATSPTPTPTALSQRQQLVVYLHEFSKEVNRELAVTAQARRIMSSRSYKEDDHSALQVQFAKCAQELDDLSVDCAAMDPPPCAASSHEAYVRFLRSRYLAVVAISDAEGKMEVSASSGHSDALRAQKFYDQAQSEFRSWSFQLRVAAKKLHVPIPFPTTAA